MAKWCPATFDKVAVIGLHNLAERGSAEQAGQRTILNKTKIKAN